MTGDSGGDENSASAGSTTTTWRSQLAGTLARPTTRRQRLLCWLLAATCLGAGVRIASPVESLIPNTAIPSFAVASGDLSCMYPGAVSSVAIEAPLFPLLAGAALSPFALGQVHSTSTRPCEDSLLTEHRWLANNVTYRALYLLGLATWLMVAAGAVLVVRTSRRARTRSESLMVLALGVAPPLFMCFSFEFHPEDPLCVGLILMAAAYVRRGRGVAAGVAGALAVLAQPFGILGVVALVLVAPRAPRRSMILAGSLCAAVVLVPLGLVSSGRVFSAVTSGGLTPTIGYTWVGRLGLGRTSLMVVSRLVPIVGAAATAIAVRWRLRDRAGESEPLMWLLALALCWRLVFEVDLYGYYFMAVAVFLVVAVAMSGRSAAVLALWFGALAWIYPPFTFMTPPTLWGWRLTAEQLGPVLVAAALAVAGIVRFQRNGPDLAAGLH